MAKAKSSDEVILDCLRKAYDAIPDLIPLSGSKALFTTKQSALAEQAVNEGYLAKQSGEVSKGKRKESPPVYGVLTEKGLRRVLDSQSPKDALESLISTVQALGRAPEPPNAGVFRDELNKATATCVRAIQDAFAELSQSVLKAVAPVGGSRVDPSSVLAALRSTLERVEPLVVKPLTAPVQTTGNSGPLQAPAIEQEIVSFVESHAQQTSVGCQFDVLMNYLKQRHPTLTVGAFQDALRKLHEAERIRLGAWPGMLDDMPEPELALFVSSKVMYHALPTHR